MWREREHVWGRVLSGLLAALLVVIPVFGSLGSITAFAAEQEDNSDHKAGMTYSYKSGEDIQISVFAQNESFAPGEEVRLSVYVRNNTTEMLTGGSLKFVGSGIENGSFSGAVSGREEYIPGKETEPAEDGGAAGEEELAGLAEDENLKEAEESAEESLEEAEDEGGSLNTSSDGSRILDIELEPGEIFETEFSGIADPELEKTGNRNIKFSFQAKKPNGTRISGRTEYLYNTGIATALPVEIGSEGELLTNEENTMYLRTVLNDADLASLFSGPSFGGDMAGAQVPPDGGDDTGKATDSNASPATSSNAQQETISGTEESRETEAQETGESTENSTENDTDSAGDSETEETAESGDGEYDETEDTKADGSHMTEAEGTQEEGETDRGDREDLNTENAGDADDRDIDSGSEEAVMPEAETEAIYVASALEDGGNWEMEEYTFDPASEDSAMTDQEDRETAGTEAEDSVEDSVKDSSTETEESAKDSSSTETSEGSSGGYTESVSSTEDVQTGGEDSGSGTESEGTAEFNLSDISYEIVTYGARLKGVSVNSQTIGSEKAEILAAVDFRVADKTAPGLYFGTAITTIRYNKKIYKTSSDFSFYVTGEGEIVLTGSIDGADIEVRGPVESFPDGEELDVKVSEVPAEKEAMVAAALEKKAQEEGITVDRMKAVDIMIIADGEEKELTGEVTVTFQQMKLERLDGMEDEIPESDKEAEPEELLFEEEAALVRARRSAARRTVVSEDEEAEGEIGADVPAAEDGETSGSEAGGKRQNLAVWHLDEEAGKLNDMDSDVDDNGNVVMKTDHFSIYLVVNVPEVNEVQITVQHYAEIDDWQASEDMPTTLSNKNITLKFKNYSGAISDVNGAQYLYPGTADPDTGEYGKKRVKIYSDDNVTLPNGAGTGLDYAVAVKDWSKVSLGGNYIVKSVTVFNDNYPEPNGVTFNEDDTERVINLSRQNRIEINYIQSTGTMEADTAFHDYNVMIQASGDKRIRSNNVGMNNLKLVNGVYDADAADQQKNVKRIGVGMQSNIGYEFEGNANGTQQGIPNSTLDSNRNITFNGYTDPGLFTTRDILTNEVYYNRASKKEVTLGISEGFNTEADCYIAKKYLPDYKLQFNRKGDTYVLEKVLKPDGSTAVDNLDVLEAKTVKWNGKEFLYTNLFWPLDDVEYGRKTNTGDNLEENGGTGYTNRDPKFGGNYGLGDNDEQLNFGNGETIKHNWYFGMRYDYEFSLGDYIGPMNYYFRGDDDFWLYIDDMLVIDLGGIHGAEGKYVDLTKWMFQKGLIAIDWGEGLVYGPNGWRDDGDIKKIVPYKTDPESGDPVDQPDKKFTMSVFFMERGGTGSCCYMNFTLPNAQPLPVKDSYTKSLEVKKEWIDGNNKYLKRPSTIFVQLKQDNADYGNPIALDAAHDWSYKWENLPVYKNILSNEGEYVYTVEEVSVPPGYVEAPIKWEGEKAIVTNILQSRIQIAKWIDNWNEESIDQGGNDLLEDEFIVTAQRTDGLEFKTGLVLKHAGTEEGEYDESKFSGYIDLIPKIKEDGTIAEEITLNIGEVVPKEYYKSKTFLSILSSELDNSSQNDVSVSGTTVTLKPGAQAVILVHNTFEHKDYFHHDHSIGNDFRGNRHQLPLGLPVSGQDQTVAAVIPEKPDDEDDLDEDVRLL